MKSNTRELVEQRHTIKKYIIFLFLVNIISVLLNGCFKFPVPDKQSLADKNKMKNNSNYTVLNFILIDDIYTLIFTGRTYATKHLRHQIHQYDDNTCLLI